MSVWKVLGVVLLATGAMTASCSYYCRCYIDSEGYRAAYCSYLAFLPTSVIPQAAYTIDVINLRPSMDPGVPIKLFPNMFSFYKNVKFLNMSNSSIAYLPDEVFVGLNYVIEIDLSYNQIRHLNGQVFRELDRLQTLILRGNPLSVSSHWDEIVSKSLKELDIGECGLRTLPANIFSKIERLTHLTADGNKLQTIGYYVLPKGIRYLDLARNNIVNVPTDVLSSMTMLKRLDLSDNPINCTCHLLVMQDWFSGNGITFQNDVKCNTPEEYKGKLLHKINENKLCHYEFMDKERELNNIKFPGHHRAHHHGSLGHGGKRHAHHQRENFVYADPNIQGDQPTPENEESEVIYSNEKTRALGTHMELVQSESHLEDTDKHEEHEPPASQEAGSSASEPDDNTEASGYEDHSSSKEREPVSEEKVAEHVDASVEGRSSDTHLPSEISQEIETDEMILANSSNTISGSVHEVSDDISDSKIDPEASGDGELATDQGESVSTKESVESVQVSSEHSDIHEPEQENTTSSESGIHVKHELVPESGESHASPSPSSEVIETASIMTHPELEVEESSSSIHGETTAHVPVVTDEPSLSITHSLPAETDASSTETVTEPSITEVEADHTVISSAPPPEDKIVQIKTDRPEVLTEPEPGVIEEGFSPVTVHPTTDKPSIPANSSDSSSSNQTEALNASKSTEDPFYMSLGSYLIVGFICLLLILLVGLAACRRKRRSVRRVKRPPVDTELNLGTELQDMDSLLPKIATENGQVKVVPKNGQVGNGKDHSIPNGNVDDEDDLNDEEAESKPLRNGTSNGKCASPPVERTTARLTVLPNSIPQTPIFIHKNIQQTE